MLYIVVQLYNSTNRYSELGGITSQRLPGNQWPIGTLLVTGSSLAIIPYCIFSREKFPAIRYLISLRMVKTSLRPCRRRRGNTYVMLVPDLHHLLVCRQYKPRPLLKPDRVDGRVIVVVLDIVRLRSSKVKEQDLP